MNDQRLAIFILSAAGMATTFMPWVKMPILGYLVGTDYNGWITFALFFLVFILAFIGNRSRVISKIKLYSLILISLVAAGMGLWKIIDVDSPLISVEYGLYLMTLLGLIIPLAAFIMGKGKSKSASKEEDNDYTFNTEVEKKGAPD